jgi:hypothetical protein
LTAQFTKTLIAVFVLAFLWQTSQAQEEQGAQDSGATETGSSQSGFEDIETFGGPESVGARLKENDAVKESRFRFDGMQRMLGPYFDWKRRVNEERGVAFGTSLYLLYQKASDSLPGEEDDALGHIFRYSARQR